MVEKAQLAATPSLPFDEDGPIFAEPWQAQAFAMAVRLSAEGHFTWPEWVNYISAEIATENNVGADRANEASLTIYYRQWLAALEKLVADKGLASASELANRTEEWRRAYLNTPHGHPIELTKAKAERK
jgi:nitrile hydratase accessory protein